MKKTWNTINSVLGRKKLKSIFPQKMKTSDGSEFSGKINIANEFNKLFTDANFDENNSNNTNFSNFLQMNITSSFRFQPITLEFLEKIANDLQPKHSFGHDELSPFIFKRIFNHIKQQLHMLINL